MSKASDAARLLLDQLRDERNRRVVLVSHCLLNENTRYAGGASRPGAVAEAIDGLIDAGYGIHQLPCPDGWLGAAPSNATEHQAVLATPPPRTLGVLPRPSAEGS